MMTHLLPQYKLQLLDHPSAFFLGLFLKLTVLMGIRAFPLEVCLHRRYPNATLRRVLWASSPEEK